MLLLLTILKLPVVLPYRGTRWLLRFIAEFFRRLYRMVVATPGMVFIHGPVGLYRRIVRVRNWLLRIIETAQSESAKWKALFTAVKLPYTALRALGLSPQMATSLLLAGSLAGGTAVGAELMKPPSFAAGDPGTFIGPSDTPVFYTPDNQTLKIDLAAVAIDTLEVSDISVALAYANSALPSGQSNSVVIGGTAASSGFTETWLEVGSMTISRWRCDRLLLSNIFVNHLILRRNASDGQSISAIPGSPANTRARAIGGGWGQSAGMQTQGGLYDQVVVSASTSGVNGKINVVLLDNWWTKGGPCVLDRLKLGTLIIEDSEIGNGNGLAIKDLVIEASVVYQQFDQVQNIEMLISPPS